MVGAQDSREASLSAGLRISQREREEGVGYVLTLVRKAWTRIKYV